MIVKFFIYLVFLVASSTLVTVEGVIIQFDEKIITLKQESGLTVKVPRAAKAKMRGVILGKDRIRVDVSSAEFLRLNKNYFSDSKSQSTETSSKKTEERRPPNEDTL